jgi:hypothetical protein
MSAQRQTDYTSTIKAWCSDAKFSEALYFKLQRKRIGPKVAHAGRRVIVIESPREYLDRLELEAASAPRIPEAV